MQSEKLNALTGIINGIAHEMNTPIGNAVTITSLLKSEVNDLMQNSNSQNTDNQSMSALKHLEVNLNKCTRLIDSFRSISVDYQSNVRMNFDINTLTKHILQKKLSTIEGKHINFSVKSDYPIVINHIPQYFETIFTQLIDNSYIHSFELKDTGRITFSFELTDKQTLRISYKDNGKTLSIPFDKTLEPFYTSMRGQGHHGLGLNVIFNTIQVMHGTLTYVPDPNGMNYEIEIPLK